MRCGGCACWLIGFRTTVISPGAVATELPNSATEPDVAENLRTMYDEVAIPADSFGSGALDIRDVLAHRVATSLTAGTAMLALAFALVVALIVRPRTGVEVGPRAGSGKRALA